MEVLIGELQNLIKNAPVAGGDTISHQSMKQLRDNGLAVRDEDGKNIPKEFGKEIHSKLMCRKMKIDFKLSLN